MTIYKERPKCRKVVEEYLKRGYTLREIACWYEYDQDYWQGRGLISIAVSEGLKLQARKMMEDDTNGKNKTHT